MSLHGYPPTRRYRSPVVTKVHRVTIRPLIMFQPSLPARLILELRTHILVCDVEVLGLGEYLRFLRAQFHGLDEFRNKYITVEMCIFEIATRIPEE